MTTKKKNKKKAKAKAQQGQVNDKPIEKETPKQVPAENKVIDTPGAVKNLIMLSVHCSTMLTSANNLKKVLLEAGYAVFLCDQMQVGEDYRDLISVNAAQCKAFIPFINLPWCNSRECGYEFKIAMRKNMVSNGIPIIMPILLEDFRVYDAFPTVFGLLCSTNGIRVEPANLGHKIWSTILASLLTNNIPPTSLVMLPARIDFPLPPGPVDPASVISSTSSIVIPTRTPLQKVPFFPSNVWEDILFFSDISTLACWTRVCSAFYFPAKRLMGGLVSTFAGTGKPGDNDSLAQYATFKEIGGLAIDPRNGCVFVGDGNNKIRKILDGVVSTFAGTGESGSIDGPTTESAFKNPCGIAVDFEGNIFVADSWNNQIRKISVDGIVSTYAGINMEIEGQTSDGHAKEATFNCPGGVAVDKEGVVYVTDSKANKIRKITREGMVSTVAGSGKRGATDGDCSEATFSYPLGIAIGKKGEIFVADALNHKIRKIFDGKVTTVAGKERGFLDGNADYALFNKPKGIAIDEDGSLIVADTENHRIRKIDTKGRVYTLAGTEKGAKDGNAKKQAMFTSPIAVAVHEGVIYIAEDSRVRKLSNF